MSSTVPGPPPVLTVARFDAASAEMLAGRCRAAVSTIDAALAGRRVSQAQAVVEWRGRFADEFDDRRAVSDSEARAVAARIEELLLRLRAAESAAVAENQRRALAHRRAVESWEARKAAAERAEAKAAS